MRSPRIGHYCHAGMSHLMRRASESPESERQAVGYPSRSEGDKGIWTSPSRPSRKRCATRCARSCRRRRPRNTCGAWPSTTTRASRPRCGARSSTSDGPGLLVPEAHGGLGLGIVDAVVVQEEMGRATFPGPFFSSAIVATLAARALGLDDRLERARGRDANAARSRSTKPVTATRSNACACARPAAVRATGSTA